MRVLVTGHGADRDAVNGARRLAAYDRLVLVSAHADAPDLRDLAENERLAGAEVEVVPVDARDLMACLSAVRDLLARHARDDVRVHVAGGPNMLAGALLLAAFQHGKEAFFCHPRGVSRLPIAAGVRLDDQFTPPERAVLARLPSTGEGDVASLVGGGVAVDGARAALLALRRKGLVLTTASAAELTPAGRYYREHVTVDRST